MRRSFFVAGWVLFLVASFAVYLPSLVQAEGINGEEIAAFDPAVVMAFSAKSKSIYLIAHRWTLNEPFSIADFGQSKTTICGGNEQFAAILSVFSSLRAKRTLSSAETRQIQDSSRESVRIAVTAGNVDLDEWTFYLPEKADSSVIGRSDNMDAAVELTLAAQSFSTLKKGCHIF